MKQRLAPGNSTCSRPRAVRRRLLQYLDVRFACYLLPGERRW